MTTHATLNFLERLQLHFHSIHYPLAINYHIIIIMFTVIQYNKGPSKGTLAMGLTRVEGGRSTYIQTSTMVPVVMVLESDLEQIDSL